MSTLVGASPLRRLDLEQAPVLGSVVGDRRGGVQIPQLPAGIDGFPITWYAIDCLRHIVTAMLRTGEAVSADRKSLRVARDPAVG